MQSINPLAITSISPLIGTIILLFIPNTNSRLCQIVALLTVSLTFVFSIWVWILFDSTISGFQFFTVWSWFSSFNIYYSIGVDGISLFFMLLTTFLSIICILVGWESVKYSLKEYFLCFLILEFLLIQVFLVLDLLLFYIFFESVLMPMFLIIGIWGSRTRKIRAAYQFFLYTLVGSLLMLLGILVIYFLVGTTDLQVLWRNTLPERLQLILWIAFFTSFAVKIPMIPFHIWLPEAHAEAPTSGSIILAGILLKLGGYGFLRFSLPLFPNATVYFTPLVLTLSLLATIYASLTTLRQVDLKKIIAYSSISHMGFVTLGIFTLNMQGLEGSILLMLSHGLVSGALFLLVGILYDRYGTRILKYYSGLIQVMPLFGLFFASFTFANIALPGTSSFVGELLVLIGLFHDSVVLTVFVGTSMIFGAGYSIWLMNRMLFGVIKSDYLSSFQDISRREFFMLASILIIVLILGIKPTILLEDIHLSGYTLLENVSFLNQK